VTGQEGSTSTRHTLTSLGWMPWAEAVKLLTPLASLWLGPGGVVERAAGHALPDRMPVATRVHAWGKESDSLWRLVPRHADGTVLVTRLDVDGAAAATDGSSITVDVSRSVGPEWERVWTVDPAPIMFLRHR